jgi:hypothetical protein
MVLYCVLTGSCFHYGTARLQVEGEEDRFQIRKAVVNVLNKQSRTAAEVIPLSWRLGWG